MKKLVILSSRFPYPLEKGDKLRLYHQIKHLSKHFEIHLISTIESNILQGVAKEVTQYCSSFSYFKIPKSSQALGLMLNIFGRLPFQVKYFYDKKIKDLIQEKISKIKPDVVYCQLIRMAPYTTKLEYPLIIDYMDAFSMIMRRQYDAEKKFYRKWFYKLEAKRLERYERLVQDNYQLKTIISEQDKMALKGISNLQIVTNGVDTEYFKSTKSEKLYDVLFAGNMGYKPNVAAAKFLVNEVIEDQPLKVIIAGARPVYEVTQLQINNVTVSGWLEDMRGAYDQSKIFVAPIFQGAGQQNKILQAMSMGVPCITTTQVNNAIGAEPDLEVIIADDAVTFKSKIKLLLQDPELAKKIAINARKLVETKYSWEEQNSKLVSLITEIAN